jgi:hypothetical protein
MSSKSVRDAVWSHLRSHWAETPVLEVINRTPALPEPPAPWVTATFAGGQETQESIGQPGQNVYRETGLIYLHVVVPAYSGDALALGLAETLRTLFRGKTLGPVQIWNADPPSTEDADNLSGLDGTWFAASIALDYAADLLG